MASTSPKPLHDDAGSGVGEILGAYDWSSTPMGHPSGWPPNLRFAFDMCQRSSVPMAIYRGEDYRLFNNDPWSSAASDLDSGWAEGLHPDDRAATFADWTHSIATGEPYDVEHRVKSTDGAYRWTRSRAFPRHDAPGVIRLWYGFSLQAPIDRNRSAQLIFEPDGCAA